MPESILRLAFSFAALIGGASASAVGADGGEPVRARLLSESAALVPGGRATIGIAFAIDPGWHLFWDGCNNTGFPITVHPKLPEGFRAGEVEWPAPHRLVSPGDILDHVYEKEVLLLLPIEIAADAATGSDVTLACRLDWVACREACVVGGADVSIRMPVRALPGRAAASAGAPLFERASARVPLASPRLPTWLRARWAPDALVVEVDGAESLAFFPRAGCESLVNPLADCAASASRLTIRYRRVGGASLAAARGVLDVKRAGEPAHQFIALDVPVSSDGTIPPSHTH